MPNASAGRFGRLAWLWLSVVVLVTINLRPFLTAPGPLGHAIQSATGMGLRTFSWLTLLPMLLMGVGTWLAPAALRRLGLAGQARTQLRQALILLHHFGKIRVLPGEAQTR